LDWFVGFFQVSCRDAAIDLYHQRGGGFPPNATEIHQNKN
jgi:hypothetical protein